MKQVDIYRKQVSVSTRFKCQRSKLGMKHGDGEPQGRLSTINQVNMPATARDNLSCSINNNLHGCVCWGVLSVNQTRMRVLCLTMSYITLLGTKYGHLDPFLCVFSSYTLNVPVTSSKPRAPEVPTLW